MSPQPSMPPVEDYPGYFTGRPPIARRRSVQIAAASFASLLLGVGIGARGSASSAPAQTDAAQLQARISAGIDRGVDEAVDEAVDDAVAQERQLSADELASAQHELSDARADLTLSQEKLSRARADLRTAKRAAQARQRKAVAAAVTRTKRDLAAQAAAAAPRSLTGSSGAAGAGTSTKTDPRFSYCYEANDRGYGPYTRGVDPEYAWYTDADGDGVVCES